MPDIELNDASIAFEEITYKNDSIDLGHNKRESQNNDLTLAEDDEWLDVLGSGDLKVKTLRKGNPNTRPQNFDIATINLKVELENGTVVEDTNNFSVEVNGSEVVQGLDLILPLLDIGQQVTAIVKPRFAYGALGLQPDIPPNATLIYNVELLNVTYPPELASVTFDNRKKKALFKKEKGNWWYSRGDATKAIQCYRAALDALQDSTAYIDENNITTEVPEDVFREMVQQKLVIYNNLAAAQLMINAYDSALKSVDNVIELEPKNVKALFRRAKILLAKGNTDEAVEGFSKVAAIEPENNAVKKELSAAKKRQMKEKLQTKSLYQRMLGTESKTEEDQQVAPQVGGISIWTKILGVVAAATVAIVVAYGSKS